MFTGINLLGLTTGLVAAIFIFQYAGYQKSFDQHFEHSDRIYRVMNNRYEGDKLIQSGQITYSAVGPQLEQDYPEVLKSTTLNHYNNVAFVYNETPFVEESVPFAENSYFKIFDHKFLAGDKETVLAEPYEMVMTFSMAKKIFGVKENVNDYLGEFVNYQSTDFQVKGILADLPNSSSLQFNAMLSRSTLFNWWGESARFSWNGSDYFHYVLLDSNTDAKSLEAKLDHFSDKYFRSDEVTGTIEKFHLQALEEVHLNPIYEYENHVTANGQMVNILILIAGFILVMAWVNYINLTTSKALKRAKEVGLRKVVGASQNQLRIQFLLEAFIVNLFSFLLALTCVQLLQPSFNNLAEIEFSLLEVLRMPFNGVALIYWLFLFLLIGSLISGIYPAFVLSKFKPAETLKGNFTHSIAGQTLRKVLVVFQFVLSTGLIAFTMIVSKQTDFMRNYDLGYNVDKVMTVKGPQITDLDTAFITQIHAFINELEKNPSIERVGTSTGVFGGRLPRTFDVRRVGDDNGVMLNRLVCNYNFLKVYDIELLAGRPFAPTDHNKEGRQVNKAMLNDKAAKLLGFASAEEAVNKQLRFFGREFTVVGVTEDFHFRSVKESVEPLLFVPFYWIAGDTYHVKYNSENTQDVIRYVANTFDQFFPGDVFNYGFTEANVEAVYAQDVQFGKVFDLFAVLGVLIACLGLVGLASHAAVQRTKEIGIRKVLGASISDILSLLSKDFLGLVILASVIGLPLTFWASKIWLEGYAYQTTLTYSFFLIPLVLVVAISLLIVVGQTLKTAQENPVKSLGEN